MCNKPPSLFRAVSAAVSALMARVKRASNSKAAPRTAAESHAGSLEFVQLHIQVEDPLTYCYTRPIKGQGVICHNNILRQGQKLASDASVISFSRDVHIIYVNITEYY